MADKAPDSTQPAQTTQQLPQWYPSPNYRTVHSNYFQYRIGSGDLTLHFASVTDLGLAPNMVTAVVGEVSVAMTWSQAKLLMESLARIISAAEEETGAAILIPFAPPGAGDVEKEATRQQIRQLYRGPQKSET